MWTTLIWMFLTCKWITEVYLVSQRIAQLHTYKLLIPSPLYVLFAFAFWICVWIEWDFSPDSIFSDCRRGKKRLKDDAAYKIIYNKYIWITRIRNLDETECTNTLAFWTWEIFQGSAKVCRYNWYCELLLLSSGAGLERLILGPC